MQKVIVQLDWYTKIVLTLIAILLAGLLAKPYVVSRPAGASSEQATIPVEIKAISLQWTDYMPVKVMNWPKKQEGGVNER